MLFLIPIRHEVARALLGRAGRAVALDRAPVRAQRSRWGHFRNATGAVIGATSLLAWRPTPLVSFYYLTRSSVYSELGYGLDELGRALRPPDSTRDRALLAMLSGCAAALVAAHRVRSRADAQPPPAAPAGHQTAPATAPAAVGS